MPPEDVRSFIPAVSTDLPSPKHIQRESWLRMFLNARVTLPYRVLLAEVIRVQEILVVLLEVRYELFEVLRGRYVVLYMLECLSFDYFEVSFHLSANLRLSSPLRILSV